MRRLLALPLSLLLIGMLPPSAVAVDECVFDDASGIVTVMVTDGSSTISVTGDAIVVDGVACGAATLTTTDTIAVTATTDLDVVTIDLSGGSFAPGKTDEGDGSSEIEMSIAGQFFSLKILGSTGSESVSMWKTGQYDNQVLANLNDDEAPTDADLTFSRQTLLDIVVALGDGTDTFGRSATSDTGVVPFADRPVDVSMGDGDDLVFAHAGGTFDAGDLLFDGADRDTLDMSWLPAGCSINLTNGSLYYAPSHISGCYQQSGNLEVSFFEVLVGGSGDDWFWGAGWDEEMRGRGGDDRFIPGDGDDLMTGGSGQDWLLMGDPRTNPTASVYFDLTASRVTGAEAGLDRYDAIEILYAITAGNVTFSGEAPGWVEMILGDGDGENVLDLSSSTHAIRILAQDWREDLDVPTGWLFVWGMESIVGSPFADRFVGYAYAPVADEVHGGPGSDRLDGSHGPDRLFGGPGPDRLDGGVGIDTCSGGRGDDTLHDCEH